MNEVAITFLENAFVLSGLDQGIHGLGGMFGLLFRVLLGERYHRLKKAEHKCQWHAAVNEDAKHWGKRNEPASTRAREEQVGQEAVEDQDDEQNHDNGLHELCKAPLTAGKD